MAQSATLLAALCGCRRAQEGNNPAPPIFRADCCPRWSPDGQQLAFLRTYEGGWFDVCVADARLRGVRTLAAGRRALHALAPRTRRSTYLGAQDLAWHPDGTQIAFTERVIHDAAKPEPRLGLAIMAVRLTDGEVGAIAVPDFEEEDDLVQFRSPRWSARAHRLAFVAEGRGGACRIGLKATAGGPPEVFSLRFDAFSDSDLPAWSPTGNLLAFRQGVLRALTSTPIESIRLIEPGGTNAGTLWQTDPASYLHFHRAQRDRGQEAIQPRVMDLSWSPGAAHIAFTVAANAAEPRTCTIWIARAHRPHRSWAASPNEDAGYLAPVWVDGESLGALRWGSTLEAVLIAIHSRATRRLCALPSDDLDWSPRRNLVAVATQRALSPAMTTTLQVLETGL